ncbi:helix-turn-helix domain-containing protein [Chryseobacterium sp. CFS15]|uniref:helix-turn-helix domain-containing protein n=1 Tax=Chryseobacterium sp. CFS15 TaxID=2986946 RepID=UPI000FA07438|nr:helix-turn-helix domain-containing protein [Chryseobacterium sp. CFS15]MDQ8140473.1 helix-turn-helix domain-containing protein [Chryseobacterium sp. CFS15]
MPDYKRIYGDILNSRYPDKKKYCENILHNDILTHLDVIKLNTIIFGEATAESWNFDKRHRSYNKETILKILQYQKKNKLSNTQLAMHYSLSRNTVARWRKLFVI